MDADTHVTALTLTLTPPLSHSGSPAAPSPSHPSASAIMAQHIAQRANIKRTDQGHTRHSNTKTAATGAASSASPASTVASTSLSVASPLRPRARAPSRFLLLLVTILVLAAAIAYVHTSMDAAQEKEDEAAAALQSRLAAQFSKRPAAPAAAELPASYDLSSAYAVQLRVLCAELNQSFADGAVLSLRGLGVAVSFEPRWTPSLQDLAMHIRVNTSQAELARSAAMEAAAAAAIVRNNDTAAATAAAADVALLAGSVPTWPKSSSLLRTMRSLALSGRWVQSGDRVLDDPASPFNPNYQLCKGRPQRNAGQRQRGRGKRTKPPRGSLRCRKPAFVSLEHLWAQQPGLLWTMLREALLDEVDARIRRAATTAAAVATDAAAAATAAAGASATTAPEINPASSASYSALHARRMRRHGLIIVHIDATTEF